MGKMPEAPWSEVPPFSENGKDRYRDANRLVKYLTGKGIYTVIPSVVDAEGRGRGPQVSVRNLPDLCAAGQSTDGSSIPLFGGIDDSDVRIVVDPEAIYQIPGYSSVAIAFGNAVNPVNGRANPGCFRTQLISNLRAAEQKHGLVFLGGLETEFFLRDAAGELESDWVKGISSKANYQRWPDQDPLFDVVQFMLSGLAAAGLHVTVAHTEVSPRQLEINTVAADLVRAAQDYMVLRVGLKKLAELAGYKVIFKAKPVERWNGSGLHTHISAKVKATGANAFFKKDRSFTEIGGQFMGGLYECAGALAFLGNLRQEDWARLNTPGYEAPVSNAFGWANRTCSFRLTGNSLSSYHVEFRVPSPGSAHAFALYSAMVGAGLWGIEKKKDAPAIVDFNTYEKPEGNGVGKLPRSRAEAQQAFAECEAMKQAFTPQQFEYLSNMAA